MDVFMQLDFTFIILFKATLEFLGPSPTLPRKVELDMVSFAR